MSRFEDFEDDELCELWDGLTMDDGLRYVVEPEDQPTYRLAAEIHAEAESRGITRSDAARWNFML